MMQVDDSKSFREPEEGWPVDKVYLSGSDFTEVELRYLDEDRLALRAQRADGSTASYVFEQLPEQYIGIAYESGDRRDVPDDLQDVLLTLGFATRPHVQEDDDEQ